jgi:uncharacterized protein
MNNISELLDLHNRALEQANGFPKHRDIFKTVSADQGRHHIGIAGPKGVGKSVLLKQMARQTRGAFYLSADTLEQGMLFEVIKTIKDKLGVNTVFIDEVHYQKSYQEDLKKIYDFLGLRAVFTSSAALSLFESETDLSRRVRLYVMDVFSFREYLDFVKGIHRDRLTMEDIIKQKWSPEYITDFGWFNDYLKGGQLPFAMEELDPLPLLANVVKKIIRNDIPVFGKVTIDELDLLEKVMRFAGRSAVDGINYTSIAKNVGITKYKAEQYVALLEKSFLLMQIFPRGTNVLKEPKILIRPPCRLIYREFDEAIGAFREDFFVQALKMAGLDFHYLKTTRGKKTADYLISSDRMEIVAEVGGRSKGPEQFKGIDATKEIIFTHSLDVDRRRRPLHLAGYLW